MQTGLATWTTEDQHQYVFKISGGAVSWRSKKQTCIALYMAEAEYMALPNATQEAAAIT